jgi:hypothetical protein
LIVADLLVGKEIGEIKLECGENGLMSKVVFVGASSPLSVVPRQTKAEGRAERTETCRCSWMQEDFDPNHKHHAINLPFEDHRRS